MDGLSSNSLRLQTALFYLHECKPVPPTSNQLNRKLHGLIQAMTFQFPTQPLIVILKQLDQFARGLMIANGHHFVFLRLSNFQHGRLGDFCLFRRPEYHTLRS